MSSQMTDFQYSWCNKIMEKIYKKEISAVFREPVNREALDVHHPTLALKAVWDDLKERKYNSIVEFFTNVRDVFYNALGSTKADSAEHLMALDLSDWFEKKIENYPTTREHEWLMKLRKCQKKLNELIETQIPPKPKPSTIQKAADTPNKKIETPAAAPPPPAVAAK